MKKKAQLFLAIIFCSIINGCDAENGFLSNKWFENNPNAMKIYFIIFITGIILYTAYGVNQRDKRKVRELKELYEKQKELFEKQNNDKISREKQKSIDKLISSSNLVVALKQDLIPVKYDSHFLNTISENQTKFDDTLLQNFLKLETYTKTRIDFNNKLFAKLDDTSLYKDGDLIRDLVEECKSSNDFLLSLILIANQMVKSFLEGDKIKFFLIYNKFEDLGVFTKEWERRLLSSIENINESLRDVLDEISDLESSLSISLSDLESAIKIK